MWGIGGRHGGRVDEWEPVEAQPTWDPTAPVEHKLSSEMPNIF